MKQNTTYTGDLLITVPLIEGEPGSAYKVHKWWSYTLQPILYLYTGEATILHLYTGDVIRDLTVDSQRYLLVNRFSTHLSLTGSHLHHFMKPHTCTEDDHAHHKHCLVSDFCLLSSALPPQHAQVPRPHTITSEGSAKHLWNMPQDTWHGDQIWKSGHRGHPWHLECNPLISHATGSPCVGGRQNSSNKYCEETDNCCPLADLLGQAQQLKNQFASLESNTPQSTPTEELS